MELDRMINLANVVHVTFAKEQPDPNIVWHKEEKVLGIRIVKEGYLWNGSEIELDTNTHKEADKPLISGKSKAIKKAHMVVTFVGGSKHIRFFEDQADMLMAKSRMFHNGKTFITL